MSLQSVSASEARAERVLSVHTWIAGICAVLVVVGGINVMSAQSNPLAQTPTLAPIAGQIARTEVDMCAYKTGAVLGMGGTCGAGVRFWVAGSNDPVVATTRAAPMLQPAYIQPGGYVMGMVSPRSLGASSEAYMLSVDGNPIIQYGSFSKPPDQTNDALAILMLLAVPAILWPFHFSLRRAARARAEVRIRSTSGWGQA
ncbi:MAG: hypothetical protein JNM47_11610 [Hyphomonadaceae bacterium]|nr:hypothetical protein [Hyphomonadaceae bacterium]